MMTRTTMKLVYGALALLVGSGAFAVLTVSLYESMTESVSLKHVGGAGRGYAFQLINRTPVERKVTQLRVLPPARQNVVYTTVREVYGQLDEHGALVIPGGNCSYVPAAEYREADGMVLPGNGSVTFRIPPLSDKDWIEATAAIVDIRFRTRPSNILVAMSEDLLLAFGIGRAKAEQTKRYLVLDSFWTPTNSSSLRGAIDAYCRELSAHDHLDVCAHSLTQITNNGAGLARQVRSTARGSRKPDH